MNHHTIGLHQAQIKRRRHTANRDTHERERRKQE